MFEGPEIPQVLLALRQTAIMMARTVGQKLAKCEGCKGRPFNPETLTMCRYCGGGRWYDVDAAGNPVRWPND